MAVNIHIDAGHYGKYNQSPCDKNYYESEMNWKLHLMFKQEMETYEGVVITQTRADQNKDLPVLERGKSAKGKDLLISFHSNAVSNKVNDSIDYPVAYVPLDGSADKLGEQLIDVVEELMKTKQGGRISTRKGKNGDYYGIIRGSVSVGVPCIIIEHSFHTNTKATKWLMDDKNLEKMAKAEAEVVAKYYKLNKKKVTTTTTTSNVTYKVQTGSFKIKEYAEAEYRKVIAAGFNAYLVETPGGYYKVWVGNYKTKSSATTMAKNLKTAGFGDFITTEWNVRPVMVSAQKSIDEIAKEVINGKWGNGTTRKTKLIKAGYDYKTVQARVNEILKGK